MANDPNNRRLSKTGVPLIRRKSSAPLSEQNYIHIAKSILEAQHQYILDVRDASDKISPCIEGLESAGLDISLIKDLGVLKNHTTHNEEHFMAALQMKPKFLDILIKGGKVGQQAAGMIIKNCLDHLDEQQRKKQRIFNLYQDIESSINARINNPNVDARQKELLTGFKEAVSPGMTALMAAQDNFFTKFDSIEGTASLALGDSKAR